MHPVQFVLIVVSVHKPILASALKKSTSSLQGKFACN
jgi:hypothetical protein